MRIGFTGEYVLEELMYYMRECLAGGHVRNTSLKVGMSSWKAHLA